MEEKEGATKVSRTVEMSIEEIRKVLDAELVTGGRNPWPSVRMGCGCDLMSDVLSFAKPNTLLLTGLVTPQVIYAAEVADIKVVCFVRGKRPRGELVKLAESKGIVLLTTPYGMFESCGRLYQRGLRGCFEMGEERKLGAGSA